MRVSIEQKLILTLAALSAISPFAIDMYIPAIENMASEFGVNVTKIQSSILIYFFGLALGQLVGGPISDAYGRKPMVLAGLGIFLVTSFTILFINNADLLLWLRFLQAFGGGVATVNVAAVVRDLFSGTESARVFSAMGAIAIIAPLIAPALGSILLVSLGHWRYIFIFLSLYALLVMIFYVKNITTIKITRKKSKITPIKNYIAVLSKKEPMLLILSLVTCTSGLYTIISSASFIYGTYFKLSQFWLVFCFSANVFTIMITARINVKLVKKYGPLKLLKVGMILQSFFGILLFVLHESSNILVMMPFFCLYVGMLGFMFGNATALILEHFPTVSASANAVIGVFQYSFGALAGTVANHYNSANLFSITAVIMSSSLLGAIILLLSTRKREVSKV